DLDAAGNRGHDRSRGELGFVGFAARERFRAPGIGKQPFSFRRAARKRDVRRETERAQPAARLAADHGQGARAIGDDDAIGGSANATADAGGVSTEDKSARRVHARLTRENYRTTNGYVAASDCGAT